jgi:hypothetical protein
MVFRSSQNSKCFGTLNAAIRSRANTFNSSAVTWAPGFEGDEGFGHLAPFFVGHGDDRALEYSRILEQGMLDLNRRDVLAARVIARAFAAYENAELSRRFSLGVKMKLLT